VERAYKYSLALALFGSALSVPALADVPPPDACDAADVGKACDNASGDTKMDLPGKCEKSVCTRATPSGSTTYDCYVCKPTANDKKDDGGCSTTGGRSNLPFVVAPLLMLGFLWQRRRRHGV
jgi:MYXO-CTERM domain-containing protein